MRKNQQSRDLKQIQLSLCVEKGRTGKRRNKVTQKYKGKTSLQSLPTIFHKFGDIFAAAHSSRSLPVEIVNPRISRAKPGGDPWKLAGRIKRSYYVENTHEQATKIFAKRNFIYPFCLNASSSESVSQWSAMMQEGVPFQITRFYLIKLSSRQSFGISTTGCYSVQAESCSYFCRQNDHRNEIWQGYNSDSFASTGLKFAYMSLLTLSLRFVKIMVIQKGLFSIQEYLKYSFEKLLRLTETNSKMLFQAW